MYESKLDLKDLQLVSYCNNKHQKDQIIFYLLKNRYRSKIFLRRYYFKHIYQGNYKPKINWEE